MSRYWCVVPAGGVGSRMKAGLPKQYLQINNQSIADITLRKLLQLDELSGIVVAVSPEDSRWNDLSIRHESRLTTCPAGEERVHSVLNGLKSLVDVADASDWVLVHDIARPCVRLEDIRNLIDSCKSHPWGGILGVPVSDTLKRTDNNGSIQVTVSRENIWRAFTPQMFRLKPLIEAIESALADSALVTDEASAIEYYGGAPLMVSGHADNIKITHPQDLPLAAYFLSDFHKTSQKGSDYDQP